MKLVAILAALIVASAGGALMLRRPAGPTWSTEYLERLRGTEPYYAGAPGRGSLGPFEVRLRGSQNEYLVIGIIYEYRNGLDAVDLEALVAGRLMQILDAITMTLANELRTDLETPRGVFRLKRRLRDAIEAAAFPKREGRIDRLLFDPFIIQRSG